jgi:hypothetical protein
MLPSTGGAFSARPSGQPIASRPWNNNLRILFSDRVEHRRGTWDQRLLGGSRTQPTNDRPWLNSFRGLGGRRCGSKLFSATAVWAAKHATTIYPAARAAGATPTAIAAERERNIASAYNSTGWHVVVPASPSLRSIWILLLATELPVIRILARLGASNTTVARYPRWGFSDRTIRRPCRTMSAVPPMATCQ